MNDHNLDDLIIDTIEPKNNKTKNLLTLVALFIIVLIVGIILSKTLLKTPENDELVFEENLTEMIAPELKLQKSAEIAKPKEESSLSTVIDEKPIEQKSEVKAPEVKAPISNPSEAAHEEGKNIEEKQPAVTEEKKTETTEIKPPVTIKPKPAIELPVTQTPENKESAKKAIHSPSKPKVEKTKNTTTKSTAPKHAPKTSATGKYYVQVGSFKQNPSPRFLNVIKSSGFAYHITSPDRTGYKKLLIGPYRTRAEVDKARDVIRDRIHKSAFVVEK